MSDKKAARILDEQLARIKSKSEQRRLEVMREKYADPNATTGWILPRPPRTGGK